MILNGRKIADKMYEALKLRIQKSAITPHVTVILVGNDPSSQAYVHQKRKQGEAIGAMLTLLQYDESVPNNELKSKIFALNTDKTVQGIIVQLPLPKGFIDEEIATLVTPEKDIDGFRPNSPFPAPIAQAVILILQTVFRKSHVDEEFLPWLRKKSIVIIGKGITAGRPILSHLRKLDTNTIGIDSKTPEKTKILKKADIIISAVGKPDVLTKDMIKKGSIVLGIGLHRGADGKLRGDYNEEEISKVASFYSPTPGGIGPINVAFLLENLVQAAERQK